MKNKQEGFINIILIIVLFVLASALVYFVSTGGNTRPIPLPSPSPTPFPSPSPLPIPKPIPKPTPIPLPAPAPSGEKIIRKVGEQESSFLIQKINRTSVDGLWFQAFPVATNVGTPKTLIVGDDIGYACEGVSEKLSSIDFSGQTITFTKITGKRPFGGCPI